MMIAETETRSWTTGKMIGRLKTGKSWTTLVKIADQRKEAL